MILKQGWPGQVLLFPGTGALNTMARYKIAKNGGGFATGLGALVNGPPVGIGYAIVTLTAGDVATLGSIQVYVEQAFAGAVVMSEHNVVPDFPGETVTEVLGNVDGSVLGGVTVGPVTVDPASRVAIADDVLNLVDGVELGLSPRDALRCMFAVLAGKDTAGPLSAAFRNFGDTKTRVAMTFDVASQRLTVTYDFS